MYKERACKTVVLERLLYPHSRDHMIGTANSIRQVTRGVAL
jgi:hypothetical protein